MAPPAKKRFIQRTLWKTPAPGGAAETAAGKQKQMAEARRALLAILSSLRFLLCQGLLGETDDDDDETNGTKRVAELVKLRGEEDIPELQVWLDRKDTSQWLSHDILSEMTEIMSHDLLRILKEETQSAECFSVVMDQMTDFRLKEQVSVCIRFVTENLETEELFVGFYERAEGLQTAEPLFQLLKDVLTRLSLPISKCRGHCYEGAAKLPGIGTGLQARMQELEPRALYTHPTARVLDLVAQDVAQNTPACAIVMGVVCDTITLIRNSPEPVAWFKEYQGEDAPSLRPLSPQAWTVEMASLQSIASNYGALLDFLEHLSVEDRHEAGYRATILLAQLLQFSTFFSLHLMLKIFVCMETFNATFQNQPLHLQNARQMVDTLRGDVASLREGFQQLWENTTAAATDLDLERPAVPIPRRRLDDGGAPPRPTFQTPEEMHRQEYSEAMATVSSSLDCRFGASVLRHMQDVEDFVVGKGDCKRIVQFYGNDFDEVQLTLHRDMCLDIAWQRGVCLNTFHDVVEFLKGDHGFERGFLRRGVLSAVTRLVKQVLTIPVTSCSSERSFSGLQRLKAHLQSTTGKARLNHLALLNCHQHVAKEEMDLDVIANKFINRKAARRTAFPIKNTHECKR